MNKKGFVLVETLIVSVFIMAIFSMVYANIIPLTGEYEKYKNYDTVESIYIAHWARAIALKGLPNTSYTSANNATSGYLDISDCSIYTVTDGASSCSAFKLMNNVSKIYLTPYSTQKIKNYVRDNNNFKRDFKEYIAYLPTYSKNTSKTPATGYYRVIVEYSLNNINKYATIEVYKK